MHITYCHAEKPVYDNSEILAENRCDFFSYYFITAPSSWNFATVYVAWENYNTAATRPGKV